MKVWSSKKIDVEPEHDLLNANSRRSWQWSLHVNRTGIDFRQCLYREERLPSGGWGERKLDHEMVSYADMSFTKHWHWGSEHGWYDGPRCSFSIGFIHFNWNFLDCKKCSKGFDDCGIL